MIIGTAALVPKMDPIAIAPSPIPAATTKNGMFELLLQPKGGFL